MACQSKQSKAAHEQQRQGLGHIHGRDSRSESFLSLWVLISPLMTDWYPSNRGVSRSYLVGLGLTNEHTNTHTHSHKHTHIHKCAHKKREREREISQDKKHTILHDFHFPLKLYNKFEENHCFVLFFTLRAMIQVTFMFSKVGDWDMIKTLWQFIQKMRWLPRIELNFWRSSHDSCKPHCTGRAPLFEIFIISFKDAY